MALSPNVIAALQLMYTGRGVSASDLNWWATDGANVTYAEAVLLFAQSPDTPNKYPFFNAPQTANKRQYIAEVFANLYSIDINDESLVPPEELAYWENWLGLSPDNYLLFPDALNNASAAAGLTERLDVLVAKTDVSLSFTETFSSVGVNVFSEAQYEASADIISGVDGTIESVAQAEAQIIDLAAAVNVFTIAEAQNQAILPPLYTIADSADNLIAGTSDSVVVGATNVIADQSPVDPLSVDDANTLLATADELAPGVTWDILDSATAVLDGGAAVSGAASVGITDTFVDIATADGLTALANFDGIYAVEDTSAAILSNTEVAAGATSVSLTDPEVAVAVADAETLQGLGNFVGPYNIEDTSAAILAAATTGAVLDAESVTLSDPEVAVTVDGAETLQGLGNFVGPYSIDDTSAAILAAATTGAVLDAESVTLSDPEVGVTVDGAETLQGLGNFVGPYSIEDTSAAILAAATTGAVLDAESVTLSDPGVAVTVDGAETLQGLGNFVGPYNIEDTSAAILAAATTGAVLDAESVTLSDPGVPVTVDGAETLQGLGNFVGPYSIDDTSAAILAAATTGAVLDAESVTLSDPEVGVTVDGAETLQGLGNFVGPYSIDDTSAAILAAATTGVVLDAESVTLSDPEVGVTVDGAETLQGLGNFVGPYSIADDLGALTDAPPQLLVDATSYALTNAPGSLGIISAEQQFLVENASNAADFTFTSVTISPSRPQVNEGSVTEILVTLSEAQAVDTTVTFFLTPGDPTAPDTGTDESNTNDFIGGQFNPITVVILAGETSATVDYSPFLDGIPEFTEGFSVVVTISGSAAGAVFDLGDLAILDGPGDGSTFPLTLGNDIATATTFIAAPDQGVGGAVGNTLNTGDKLTGIGEDTSLTVNWVASTFGSNLVQLSMKGVETLNATLLGDDLTIASNNPAVGEVEGLLNVNANGSIGGDLSLIDLQTALETITVQNYFFGDDVSATIADPALADPDNVLRLTLDQVTTSPGGNTRVSVSDFSGTEGYENLGITSGVTTTSKGITNTVEIDGIVAVESIGITGFENLTLATSLISSTVKVDATGSALIPEFEGNSLFTGDLKAFVDTEGGDITFLSGSGNDEISIARDALEAGHVLDGNAGDDLLTITGDAFSKVDAGHTVIGGEGDDTILLTGVADGPLAGHVVNSFDLVNEVGGAGDDTITITGNAIGDSAGHVVFGGSGEDAILIEGDAVGGSDGGHDVFAGDDDDTVRITGNSFAADVSGHSVEGGAGDDLIEISGDAVIVPFDQTVANPFFDPSRPSDGTLVIPPGQTLPTTQQQYEALVASLGDPNANYDSFLEQVIFGAHTVRGGEGNDTILFGPIVGEPGNGNGLHEAFGDEGDDFIEMTGIGGVVFDGGAGDDTLIGGDGEPNPLFPAPGEPSTILGNDILSGGEGDDFLFGGKGNDVLTGGEDDDIMSGGEGDDFFDVDAGFDVIEDLGDADSVTGDQFVVRPDAEAEIRVVQDWAATNATFNQGIATLTIENPGGGSVDLSASNAVANTNGYTVIGNIGDDAIIGSLDADTLFGGRGNDFIDGGLSDDIIEGNDDDDTIVGGYGDDLIDAGAGNDLVAGDEFVPFADITPANALQNGGDDVIEGGSSGGLFTLVPYLAPADFITGDWQIGTGNVFFNIDQGNAPLLGGNDLIFADASDTAVTVDSGDNFLIGDLSVFAGKNNSFIDFKNLTLIGGDDEMFAAGGDDVFVGDLGAFIGKNANVDLSGLQLGEFDFVKFEPVAGDDFASGGAGDDLLVGDLLVQTGKNSTIDVTDTTLVGGDDSLIGGSGADFLGGDFVLTIEDALGGDILQQTLGLEPELNIIGGNDFLEGGQGNDTYYGGSGIDTIVIGNNIIGPGGIGPNGDNEIWYVNGQNENAARNGANVDVITGFNTINDKFIFSSGFENFLGGGLNLQAGNATFADGRIGAQLAGVTTNVALNGTVFNLNGTVTNASANTIFDVFNDVTVAQASTSGGTTVFSVAPANPLLFFLRTPIGVTASVLEMQQINVTSGDLAGSQFLFINNGIADISAQDDFLVDITGLTGTLGLDLTNNFEVRDAANFTV